MRDGEIDRERIREIEREGRERGRGEKRSMGRWNRN